MIAVYPQLPMTPVYQTEDGARFNTLAEAAQHVGTVTVNQNHRLMRRPGRSPDFPSLERSARVIASNPSDFARSTLLHEVSARLGSFTLETRSLLGRHTGSGVIGVEDMAKQMVSILESHISLCWDSEATHIIPFSSGFDSRLLMALIHRLYQKRGPEWLGTVRFVTFEPEIAYARQVWRHFGWAEDTWCPLNPSAAPVDYFAACLDFETLGSRLSEAERFWGGALLAELHLGALGLLEGKVQGVSALYSDETSKWNRKRWGSVAWFTACWLLDNPGVLPGRPDIPFILPYVCAERMRFLTEYRLPTTVDDAKLAMLRAVSPALANQNTLPNFRFQIGPMRDRNGGFEDPQRVSRETWEKMEASYAESWYAHNVGPKTLGLSGRPAVAYYDDENCHYYRAAIYEHIIKLGVTVRAPWA